MIMAGLCALQSNDMSLIPAHEAKNLYLKNDTLIKTSINRLIPSLSMVVAAAYCHAHSLRFTPPSPDLGFVDNFLLMIGLVDSLTGLPNPRYSGYVEKLWILLADHEMTCSTAALLLTSSALPDPITSLVSAIAALYGPLHGGAIEVAYKDIAAMAAKSDGVACKMKAVKAGKERLYGYGHRIYKVADPRYKHIAGILAELSAEIEADSVLKTAFELDKVARNDEYFLKRGLGPNADLFAGFAWGGMGFQPQWILPVSILGRMQGFMAHWREAMSGPPRIWRPGQIYTGDLAQKMEL
jgi:citrate synthase